MPYAEVIYEPGSKSVVSYDNEDELKGFLMEHHNRAKQGEPGGPAGNPAERVTKVILYENHPADFGVGGKVNAETLNNLLSGMAKDGQVDGHQLVEAVRDEMSPVYPIDQGRHESMYKMDGTLMDISFLESGGEE